MEIIKLKEAVFAWKKNVTFFTSNFDTLQFNFDSIWNIHNIFFIKM